jgi:hypothetical protein
MKLVALIRTLNESHRIERCCWAYQFCDEILIADGGSTDNTVELALKWPKVKVRPFTIRVECEGGIWRNPDGAHLNFLYDWAHEEHADWIISQDCDQRPNVHLKRDARKLMEETDRDFILATQIFLWKNTMYFPNMSLTSHVYGHRPDLEGNWSHGIWAWRASINLRAIDKMPHYEFSIDGGKTSILPEKWEMDRTIDPPYCFLHFGWETDEMVEKMVKYYRDSKLIPAQKYPLDFCGHPLPLEPWMVEE